ncbi:MAG TPA: hypothetical protein ENJ09_15560 [Planctomycetes bacterium]|nr:hypothetical protein [Planctomycetota bacterium]
MPPESKATSVPLTPEEGPPAGPRLGGLVRHSAIYSAAPLLRQLIAVGMTRLYTLWLGDSGFGVKGVIDLWMIGLQQLLGVNALSALVRFYYDSKDPKERAATVTSTTLLVSALAWSICALAWIAAPSLQPLLLPSTSEFADGELLGLLRLMLLLIPFQLSTQSGYYYLQAIRRSGLYTTIQTAKLLFEIALNFVLLGHFDMGVRGFLLSMLAGEALTTVLLCGWMFRDLGVHFRARLLKPLVAYALPLIPVGVCQLAIHSLDRYLLVDLTTGDNGWSTTGVYELGYKIGFLVTGVLLGPFIQIFHPWIFDIEDETERADHLRRVATWAVLAIASVSLGVILFGRQAAMLLGGEEKFWDAWRVIPWIAGGYVFWALYHVAQIPVFIAKRTGRLFVINLTALGVNVIANVTLIPRYGFIGAGIATSLTFLVLSGLGFLTARSVSPVRFELGRLAQITALVVAAGALAFLFDGMEVDGRLGLVETIACKAAVAAALLGAAWRIILHADERAALVGFVAARLGR